MIFSTDLKMTNLEMKMNNLEQSMLQTGDVGRLQEKLWNPARTQRPRQNCKDCVVFQLKVRQ